MALGDQGPGFLTSRLSDGIAWARKWSLFPYPFVTACCGMEYMSVASAHYDLDRFGAAWPRFTPRQADMLLVVGTISHKMAPVLSPNKTWEGAVAGFLAALLGMAAACLLSRWFNALPQWTLAHYLGIGAVLSVVSQVGDLAESSLKRAAGVKDSGSLFPGHGGVLDRCDGFLFATPALYYMLVLFIHG